MMKKPKFMFFSEKQLHLNNVDIIIVDTDQYYMQSPTTSKYIHLPKGGYYTITNLLTGLNLSMPDGNHYLKDRLQLQEPNTNNDNQLWMFDQVSLLKYEIVHAKSTLVLENVTNSNYCKLEFGIRWTSQLFYLEPINREAELCGPQNKNQYQPPLPNFTFQQQKVRKKSSKSKLQIKNGIFKNLTFQAGERFTLQFRIKDKEKSLKYLYYSQNNNPSQQNSKRIKFMQLDAENLCKNSIWQIRQIFRQQNETLSKCCYISSIRSGDVLDVPLASQKEGVQIIQYPCNFRFNQKWIFEKVEDFSGYGYYMIKNAKNGLYLDIKEQSTKQGAPIIQYRNHKGKNQVWRLQQQGKRTYLIRSALDKNLLLGVKQNSIKECAEIVTSKRASQCFWIIYGDFHL